MLSSAARRCASAIARLPVAAQYSSQAGPKNLMAACVIERLPLVVPEMPKWEQEYRAWSEERRRAYYKTLPAGIVEPKDPDDAPHLQQWTPAKVPDPATEKDLRDIKRHAREFLYLIVKRADGKWGFPTAKHAAGETMRQAAERASKEQLDLRSLEVFFIGNAPIAHFSPPGGAGETHFLYRASYVEGSVKPAGKGVFTDHAWVSKGEIKEFFDPALHEVLDGALATTVL